MTIEKLQEMDSKLKIKGVSSKIRNLFFVTSLLVANVVNAEDDYDFSNFDDTNTATEESSQTSNSDSDRLLVASNSQRFGYQDPYKKPHEIIKNQPVGEKDNSHNFALSGTLGSVIGSNSAFYDYDETKLSLVKTQGSMSVSADGYKMQSSAGFLGVSLIDSTELIAEGLFLSLVIDSENFVSRFHINQTLEFYNLSLVYKNPNLNVTFLTNQSFGGEKSVIGIDLNSKSLDELVKYLTLNAKILRNQDGRDIVNLDLNTSLSRFIDMNISKTVSLSVDVNMSLNFSSKGPELMGGLFATFTSK